jgi:ketol-acid reductoisomerase
MAKIFYDKDCDLAIIRAKKVAIIGYGSQGHAHALNLKDSGVDVRVGLHASSKSVAKAKAVGLKVLPVAEAAAWADVVMILIPDTSQGKVYAAEIAPHLGPGKTLMFAHGFNIRFGYQPEVAYFECLHELKLIVDLMYRGGLRYMRYSISDTAEYGDYVSGPRVVDAHTKETMGKLLEEIRSGQFARKWIEENETGRKWFSAQRVKERDLLVEAVGEKLRAMMPFLDPVKVEPQE